MTKEVKNILYDTLQGGSTFFNMGFDSEQLSWVKGVCKTLETSCDEYADACNKYVNTASETMQKFYGEVFELEDLSDSEEQEPENLKNDALTDDPTELSEDHAENTSRQMPSDCGQEQPTVTATEGSNLGMLSNLQGQNLGFAFTSSDDEDQVPSRAVCCPDDVEESRNEETADVEESHDEETADAEESHDEETADGEESYDEETTDAEESCDEETAEEICDEKSSSLGAEASCNEESAETLSSSADVLVSPSEDDSRLGTSSQYRGSLTISGCPPPVKVKVADKAEVSKGREHSTSSKTDILIHTSQTGEFEAITVEEFVEDAINNKMALNSYYCTGRSMSLKKKLKNVFLPHKGFERANHRDPISELAMQIRKKPPSSGCESIESEWEFL